MFETILKYFIFNLKCFICIVFYLFLAGAGEIIVWDLPTGNILWKLNLGNVLLSDLAWSTNNVLLASLTTGVILKCDTSE